MAFDIKQQARRLFEEVWNQGRMETVDELVDPAYQGRDPLAGTIDRQAFKQLVAGYREAFPNIHMEVNEVLAEGDCVLVRWTATGTNLGSLMGNPPTGKNAVVGGLTLSEFQKGRMVRDTSQWDALGLFNQLGGEKMVPITSRTQPGLSVTGRH